ncbi:MAG: S8 family serine peptidase, partial [Bacteroidia bacterium]|nr:S8 family serine peptidase [Bacteroidia bacterium]
MLIRSTLKLVLVQIIFCCLTVPLFAAEHVEGQLLVQIKKEASIREICNDLSKVDGVETDLKAVRLVSKHMNVWLVEFDHHQIAEQEMLFHTHSHKSVVVAQFNHVVKHRATTPNDAQFTSQWQYINTGANGGTVDGDIDADDAWDITTGGLTSLGDTIVVCALDDGIDLTHPDFGNNRWRNNAEIPNNSIDDDANGYVDDKEGWSIVTNDDNISGGGHGTPVAGIMGAQGNNGIGVTGVNWDVEVMVLKNNFNTNEAAVLAAYDYPLTMRKIYNETNGDEGAFVVSTNASWGIDFGQPSNAPLWCAMYDTLGLHGIISCGATINGNQNVDVVGDLPTACPSDYLISVTNCDNTDNKVTSAGYGATTIDLGAHGAGAFTTNGSGGYSGFGGTSGATPHVTGAIGLLYSAPCVGLIQIAKTNPALAATMVRDYILNGVDSNASLQGITTTGGRLNLHKSLLELMNNCPTGGCTEPFSISVSSITDSSATINWSTVPDVDTVVVQYRDSSSSTWITVYDTSSSIDLGSLAICTVYEYRLKSLCDTAESAYTAIMYFQTEGCCEVPVGVQIANITDSTASIDWNDVMTASSFTIR